MISDLKHIFVRSYESTKKSLRNRVLLQFPGSGNPGNDPGSGKGFPGSNSR